MISVLIVAGVVLLIVLSRKRKNRPRGPSRAVTTKTTRTVYTISARNQKPMDAEKVRKEQFKRMQADADLIHYTQVKKDLMQAYDASGAVYGDTEKAIRKRIQYDNAIRRTEKQIEKAAYNAKRTGL